MRTRFALFSAAFLLPALLLTAAGCQSGGDLIANPHLTTEPAAFVASAMPVMPALPRELQKATVVPVFVQPGDVLLLEPTSPDDPPRVPADQTVLPDGTIDLGIYGRPVVAGLSPEEIEMVVRSAVLALEPDLFELPEGIDEEDREAESARRLRGPINVRLIADESAVFYALGEVAAPGSYPLIGRETVLDAILKAGGLTDRADRCEIILSRPTAPGECRVVLRVCYNRLVQLGDATTNYQIMPGDRIHVASKRCLQGLHFWKKGCEYCCDTGSCPCPTPHTSGHLVPAFPPPPVPSLEHLIGAGSALPPLPGESETPMPESAGDGSLPGDADPTDAGPEDAAESPRDEDLDPELPQLDLPGDTPPPPKFDLPEVDLSHRPWRRRQ